MRHSESSARSYLLYALFIRGRNSSFGLSRITECALRKMSCFSFIKCLRPPELPAIAFWLSRHASTSDGAGCNLRNRTSYELGTDASALAIRTQRKDRGSYAHDL